MIDESIMEKIIPLPDEDEEMEKVQGELEGEGFPITNFKKGGIFYHLCRMLVTIYIELKELARTIVNGCFIKPLAEHPAKDVPLIQCFLQLLQV